jgi:hypothetical protein
MERSASQQTKPAAKQHHYSGSLISVLMTGGFAPLTDVVQQLKSSRKYVRRQPSLFTDTAYPARQQTRSAIETAANPSSMSLTNADKVFFFPSRTASFPSTALYGG